MKQASGMQREFVKIEKFGRKQRGFSLVEILIGAAIMGLLAAGVAQAIYQVITVNSSGNARMTAVKQVEYAIDTMRQDAVMAQQTIASPDLYPEDTNPDGVLMFRWVNWTDNKTVEVIYLLEGTDLKRRLLIDGVDNQIRTIGKKIKTLSFDNMVSFVNDNKITLTILSEVESFRLVNESRTFDIHPRPAT